MKILKKQLIVVAGLLCAAASAYNPAIGLKSVYYAGASYCTAGSIESWTCGEACASTTQLTSVATVMNND